MNYSTSSENHRPGSEENVKKALVTISTCYYSSLKESIDFQEDPFVHYTAQRMIHLQHSLDHFNERLFMGYLALSSA